MATLLITEALQQVKIITDRIAKKRQTINKYLTYNSRFKDPLEAQGGSVKVIAAEFQAVNDLEQNLVNVRVAIAKKNLETTLTVEGVTKSVAEWLFWRREVADMKNSSFSQMSAFITQARTRHEQEVRTATAVTAADVKESQLIVNLDELQLSKDAEQLGLILGSLDAKLSILNATTTIEV